MGDHGEPASTPGQELAPEQVAAPSLSASPLTAPSPSPSIAPSDLAPDPTPSLRRTILAVLATTVLVTVASYTNPIGHGAELVGMIFLAATYVLVLRHSSRFIADHGLTLGGLFESKPLSPLRMLREGGVAFGLAFALFIVVGIPFTIAFLLLYTRHHHHFDFSTLQQLPARIAAHVAVIALPEEAFFRGFLQTELDTAFPRKLKILGAEITWALPLASLIFAVGHVFTVPEAGRLAVFFPSLLFGFLRARTRGIGASVFFHALCNLLSASLMAGYGFHPS